MYPTQAKAPWGEAELTALRAAVQRTMSGHRAAHTLAVERMVVRMCALYCPEETNLLRAAALLHDTTKEWTPQQQEAVCAAMGLPVTPEDVLAPKCFHARTAAALIPKNYPEFHHPGVVSAVRWHTTGRADMTLTEKILYLADYIDDTRTFPECVELRSMFWNPHPETMSMEERLIHLDRVILTAYDMTIRNLLEECAPISPDTVQARNSLILEIRERQRKE